MKIVNLFIKGLLIICMIMVGNSIAMNQENPQMSDQEIESMFNEFWQSIDQDTLNELAKIGEEIIKEAESKGMDPFDYIMQESEKEAPVTLPEPLKVAPINTKAPVIINVSRTGQAKDFLKALEQAIPSIRQKAENNSTIYRMLTPYKYDLNDLTYFVVLILNNEHLLNYLADKEFESLFNQLKTLSVALVDLDNKLQIAAFNLKGKTPYQVLQIPRNATQEEIVAAYEKLAPQKDPERIKKRLKQKNLSPLELEEQVEQAQKEFLQLNKAYTQLRSEHEALFLTQKIVEALSKAFNTDKIIDELKKLLAKHEPEILKLKTEREKIEEEARQTQKRAQEIAALMPSLYFNMPSYLGGYDSSASSYSPPSFNYPSLSGYNPTSYNPPAASPNTIQPSTLPADKKPSTGSGKKGGTKESKSKKDKEDGKKDTKKSLTMPESPMSQEVFKKMLNIETLRNELLQTVDTNKPLIEGFKQHLTSKFDDSQSEEVDKNKKFLSQDMKESIEKLLKAIKKDQEDLAENKNSSDLDRYNKEVAKLLDKLVKSKSLKMLVTEVTSQAIETTPGLPPANIHDDKKFIYRGEYNNKITKETQEKNLKDVPNIQDPTKPALMEYHKPLIDLHHSYSKLKNLAKIENLKKQTPVKGKQIR